MSHRFRWSFDDGPADLELEAGDHPKSCDSGCEGEGDDDGSKSLKC